jgi:hypothetical protein
LVAVERDLKRVAVGPETNVMSLEPQLDHNRVEYDRLGRRKWHVAGVALGVVVILPLALPMELVLDLWIPLFIVILVIIGSLEAKRTLVFRRDLRERRAADQGGRVDGS